MKNPVIVPTILKYLSTLRAQVKGLKRKYLRKYKGKTRWKAKKRWGRPSAGVVWKDLDSLERFAETIEKRI